MESHFLAEFVEGDAGFKRGIWYNRDGDCLEYSTVNEAVVADRIDCVITIYRSAVDNRPVGFQIKGVSAILGLMDATHLRVVCGESNAVVRHVKVEVALMAALKKSLSENPQATRHLDRYAKVLSVMAEAERESDLEIAGTR